MAQHTPAPWMVAPAHQGAVYAAAEMSDRNSQPIADCDGDQHNKRPHDECRANAQLIASAPDLLEALRLVCTMLNELGGLNRGGATHKAVEAAIAKAEGR